VVSQADIPPGGEGKVEVKVHTAGRAGPLSKSVTVETDDPVEPRAVLTVNCNVVVDVDLERTFVPLGMVKLGDEPAMAIPFIGKALDAAEFGEVRVDMPDLKAWLVKVNKDGRQVPQLEMKYKATALGAASGRVTVKLLKPRVADLVVSLNVNVQGDITILPPQVFLRASAQGAVAPQVVELKTDKAPFKVKKVEDPDRLLDVRLETAEPGKWYKLHVALKDGKGPGHDFSTKVVVTTDARQQPTLVVPVTFSASRLPLPITGGALGVPREGKPPIKLLNKQPFKVKGPPLKEEAPGNP
jgi:hypothetical protein